MGGIQDREGESETVESKTDSFWKKASPSKGVADEVLERKRPKNGMDSIVRFLKILAGSFKTLIS